MLLNVEPTATPSQIRKAYHKMALKVHPDKNPSEEAVASFQALQKAYAILSNPEKRRRYDRTGCTDEDSQSFDDAYAHYRSVYTEISREDIDEFAGRYRESDMEQSDLREFYMRYNGDLTNLLHFIPLSTVDDCPRFVAYFEAAIAEGSLENLPKFGSTKSKIKECVDDEEDLDGEDLDRDEDEDEDDLEADDDDDLDDFIADDEDEDEDDTGSSAAAAEPSITSAKKGRKDASERKEKGKPKKPRESMKKKKGGGAAHGGAAGLEGVDPALLAMFAARNAERESGMDAFEARWASKASQGSKSKKKPKSKK